MNLVTTQQISHPQLHNFFRPTSTITTPPVKSVKMDHPCQVSSKLQATAVPSDLGLTTVPGTHTNPNPAEFVSMFAGISINNCVFQLSQNPVHGMLSSMTANTDNNHQAPKLK